VAYANRIAQVKNRVSLSGSSTYVDPFLSSVSLPNWPVGDGRIAVERKFKLHANLTCPCDTADGCVLQISSRSWVNG
jgi:hypothetical protein